MTFFVFVWGLNMQLMIIERTKIYWPLLVAISLIWLAIAFLTFMALQHEDHLTYTADDAYIQMAIARNVVENYSWGINSGEFNSTSSSPLWVLLLSGIYIITGANDLAPYALNILFVTLVIATAFVILRKMELSSWSIFAILLAIVIFTPLPPLVLLGMEHSLQILMGIVFVYLSAAVISNGKAGSINRDIGWLLVLTPLLVLCRFEGISLIVIICLLMFFYRRWLLALLIGTLGLLPVAVYGIISLANGGLIVANPLALKTNIPFFPISSWIKNNILYIPTTFMQLTFNATFLTLTLAAVLVFSLSYSRKKRSVEKHNWHEASIISLVFLAAVFIQFQTNTSQDYRYDAYLISIGILAITVPLFQYFREINWWWRKQSLRGRTIIMLLALTLLLCLMPLAQRGFLIQRAAPLESRRVFEQHYFMAEFLDRYYTGKAVAANDIGAINFYADVYCVDLLGLADNETAKVLVESRGAAPGDQSQVLSREQIDIKTREKGTDIALLYDNWFMRNGESTIPENWILIGRWLCRNYNTNRFDKVSFYAVDPDEADKLKHNLQEFSSVLPVFVQQQGPYTTDA